MKLAAKIGAALGVFALLAAGARCAEETKTQTVQFPAGKGMASGVLIEPQKLGRYPALVVAPEWRGVTDWVQTESTKLAEQGYVVLAVDFYGGKVAATADEASELSRGVTTDDAIANLQGAFAYLQALKEVDRDHVGAIGWGMGGGYVLKFAARQPKLSACVVNYGVLPTDPNDLQQIAAPLLGNFGAEDHGVSTADVQAFQKSMQALQRRIDIKIYDGAGNAFENPSNADAYRPAAAEDAWKRTIDFLGKMMK
jgi:carboxymethylenebutenolidase